MFSASVWRASYAAARSNENAARRRRLHNQQRVRQSRTRSSLSSADFSPANGLSLRTFQG